MLEFIKQKLAAHSLARKQKQTAAELQAIYDAREALLAREKYLLRYSSHLSVREIDQNVVARRTARAHLG